MPNAPLANMGLVLPTENSDAGVYDQYLNDALELVDAHDHSTGKGVQIPTAGIRINADLTMTTSGTSYALKDAKAVDFTPVAAASMTAYAGALFTNSSDSNNLYFRTQAGTNVRITNGSQLDFTVAGGIGGDYVAAGAAVAYVSASDTYTFKKPTPGNWARLQAGALRISEYNTTESTYVELACPAALAGTYTITFPTTAPASTSLVQMSSAGVLTASPTGTVASGAITSTGSITGTDIRYTAATTVHIAGCAAALPSASAPVYTCNDSTGEAVWTFATGNRIALPAAFLRTNDRITAFGCRANSAAGGSGTLDTKLWRQTSTSAPAQVGSTLSHTNTTTDQTHSLASPTTVAAGDEFHLTVRCTAGTPVFYDVFITYDRP